MGSYDRARPRSSKTIETALRNMLEEESCTASCWFLAKLTADKCYSLVLTNDMS